MISPLTVAENSEKKRLVLDLSELNKLVPEKKFKLEDYKTLSPFLIDSNVGIKFDLKSGYHHVEIDKNFTKYLGFAWGGGSWFEFKVLPFGLKSAPYVFTKILRPLVQKWREEGMKFVLYLDDGICVCNSKREGIVNAIKIKKGLGELGWVTAENKCVWDPAQIISWLGVEMDFVKRELRITEKRISSLLNTCQKLLTKPTISARKLAVGVGKLISMHTVMGPPRSCSRAIVAGSYPAWRHGTVRRHCPKTVERRWKLG